MSSSEKASSWGCAVPATVPLFEKQMRALPKTYRCAATLSFTKEEARKLFPQFFAVEGNPDNYPVNSDKVSVLIASGGVSSVQNTWPKTMTYIHGTLVSWQGPHDPFTHTCMHACLLVHVRTPREHVHAVKQQRMVQRMLSM